MSTSPHTPESVFTYAAPRLKFGPGAVTEIGHDVAGLGARSALVVTDPRLAATGHPERVAEALRTAGLRVDVHDSAAVEPSDASLAAAVERAKGAAPFDAVVAVGGGSSIDTAKAVSLLLTNPGELMDYVNAPVGGGRAPEQPVLPLVAVPTTTGTGAESTTVCVLDVLASKVKTGISHERLRPVLAVVDHELTETQPPGVTASSGMDILCHALESWTARPYTSYEHKTPEQRVPYCGSNPISDLYAEKAMRLLAGPSAGRWPVRSRRGPTWRSRRPSRGWASATPVCTSRTPTPTRSPDGSTTSAPTSGRATTTSTRRWCPTAWRSRRRLRRPSR